MFQISLSTAPYFYTVVGNLGSDGCGWAEGGEGGWFGVDQDKRTWF